ncbi:hypothetical protein L1887_07473 [Cichorium endivia]|nr:hypothetical protein L1887_07473 [Cichorium endivia]
MERWNFVARKRKRDVYVRIGPNHVNGNRHGYMASSAHGEDNGDQVLTHEPSMTCQDLEKTYMETKSVDSTEGEEVDALSSDPFDIRDLIAEYFKNIKKSPM